MMNKKNLRDNFEMVELNDDEFESVAGGRRENKGNVSIVEQK